MSPRDHRGHQMMVGDLVEQIGEGLELARRGMVVALTGEERDVAIVELDFDYVPGVVWSGYVPREPKTVATTGADWRIINRF